MAIDPMAGFPPQPYQKLVRPMFRTLAISSSGLSAQRQRIEVIAQNIANADVTRTPEGGPYRRQVIRLESATAEAQPFEMVGNAVAPFRLASGDPLEHMAGVRVAAVEEDVTEGPLTYDPGHPDADERGYFRAPNVRITDELVDLMDARRVYEANATVFQVARAMIRASLNI
jgi:flagellar basal-body rod protein FlgC